ncbi:MAG TPA: DUF6468 domain-containing protein [Rhizomicrobium sp.]|jgi:hypothetical protein|nr:DUF6468 domain-containing protein [Rhizomicrobium sp.]
MTVTLIAEAILSLLLVATLIYCAVLERKLSALRKGQEGIKAIIGDLDSAIASAGASMRALKAAAAGAAETLDGRIARGRALADELSLVTASGDRIAERIAQGAMVTPKNVANLPSGSVMGRLDALRSVR